MNESSILIEPIIDGQPHNSAVQAKAFQFALKITNRSNSPSDPFTISSVVITSAQGQNINDNFSGKSFSVGVINPEESTIIEVGKNGQLMFGLVTVTVIITPSNVARPVTVLQRNPFTGSVCPIGNNHWVDFFYLKSSNEDLQEKTNKLLVILTLIIAASALLTALPILRNIYNTFGPR